ncbi:MAG: hypothetical protein VB093_01565 [Propionicimonas sp.]|jgi:hypothetical protein|uniref:hypothetical protein n=1 Tax=Rothia kristinae TaxID=37923 RepID=UPI0022E95B13|nr:hypothetical protein [Rothia kristinae]MEA5052118.1 hypothetical protein [Propionicimonas sp.]
MDQPAEPRRHRRLLIAAIAGGLALLVAVGVGIYGLVRGPGDTRRDPAPSGTVTIGPSTPSSTPAGPVRLPATGDAEAFAHAVAEALFTWDTLSGATPSDYAQVLSDAADDSEADALASDVRAYLPTAEAWAQLTTYQTRQWLAIDTAAVPEAWTTAEAQAAPGQLPQGATAYTITGTRHRTGIWGTDPVEASRPVSFTVFLVCAPPAPEFRADLCRLLRLSELDNPLR